jgi:predicted PurR-regulated permease PerM
LACSAFPWGALVAILNFVPYLGALTGIICMTIGAILSFDSLGYALIFPAVYLGFGTLEVTSLRHG